LIGRYLRYSTILVSDLFPMVGPITQLVNFCVGLLPYMTAYSFWGPTNQTPPYRGNVVILSIFSVRTNRRAISMIFVRLSVCLPSGTGVHS